MTDRNSAVSQAFTEIREGISMRSMTLRTTVGAIIVGAAAGWLAMHSASRVTAAQRILDFKCLPDRVCAGITQANSTDCGTNGDCRGTQTSAKFSACTFEVNAFCTPDASKYGSATCPGICVGTISTTCSTVAAGCQ